MYYAVIQVHRLGNEGVIMMMMMMILISMLYAIDKKLFQTKRVQ
jgi:hypothetical protein